MNILILGASGYLGTNSINYFVGVKDYKVYAHSVDKEFFSKSERIKFTSFDIFNPEELNEYIEKKEIEVVINYIYIDSKKESQRLVNSLGKIFENVKLIHISSSVVYGNVVGKAKEDDKLKGNSKYAKIKIEEEKLLSYKKNCIIIRLFNPLNYIPEYIIPNTKSKQLFEIIKKSEEVILYVDKDGNFINKDYIEIEAYLDYLNALINVDAKGIYNIGTGETKSTYDIFERYCKKGASFKKEVRNIEIMNSCANIDKLKLEVNGFEKKRGDR